MARSGKVHLVGSIPMADPREVFSRVGGALKEALARIPDGETGSRIDWIQWQYPLFTDHPDLEPAPMDERTYGVRKLMRVKAGIHPATLSFGPLGYAEAAKHSYDIFLKLRQEGTIAPGTRFQVNLPTPTAPVSAFVAPESLLAIEPAYERAMLAEVDAIAAAIPQRDLGIQWDVAREFMFIENVAQAPYEDVIGGVSDRCARLGDHVPGGAELGYHLCYGDFGHKHFFDPIDATKLVQVANAISAKTVRPIDWIHMPVPRDRDDDGYFAPLKTLRLHPSTRLFLGLVHHGDGLEGTRRRIETARRHVAAFGIGTECGWGRRDKETIAELLDLHAQAAELV